MTTQTDVAKCPHCATELPARDITEGWCDSCGKRLPSMIQQQARNRGPARVSSSPAHPAVPKTRLLIVGFAVALLFGLAAAVIAWKAV